MSLLHCFHAVSNCLKWISAFLLLSLQPQKAAGMEAHTLFFSNARFAQNWPTTETLVVWLSWVMRILCQRNFFSVCSGWSLRLYIAMRVQARHFLCWIITSPWRSTPFSLVCLPVLIDSSVSHFWCFLSLTSVIILEVYSEYYITNICQIPFKCEYTVFKCEYIADQSIRWSVMTNVWSSTNEFGEQRATDWVCIWRRKPTI